MTWTPNFSSQSAALHFKCRRQKRKFVLLQVPPWECFVQTKGKPRQIPRADNPPCLPVLIPLRFPFFQLRCIQCSAEFCTLIPQPSSPLPNSSLSPSFNQQPCFDFHLRLFVAHCTFGSFQWHFNVPTRTAAAPFHQGLLTAVLASSPPSSTKLPPPPHPLGFFAYFAPFAGRHCQNS